jgi:hypothetical protein
MADRAEPSSRVSRRDFARKAALTAATAAVLPGGVLSRPLELGGSLVPVASQAQPQEGKLSPESQSEADTTFQAILRRYGDRLSEEQKTDLRRLANEAQKPLETIRAFPWNNADQPGNVLKLYPDPKTQEHSSKPTRS